MHALQHMIARVFWTPAARPPTHARALTGQLVSSRAHSLRQGRVAVALSQCGQRSMQAWAGVAQREQWPSHGAVMGAWHPCLPGQQCGGSDGGCIAQRRGRAAAASARQRRTRTVARVSDDRFPAPAPSASPLRTACTLAAEGMALKDVSSSSG